MVILQFVGHSSSRNLPKLAPSAAIGMPSSMTPLMEDSTTDLTMSNAVMTVSSRLVTAVDQRLHLSHGPNMVTIQCLQTKVKLVADGAAVLQQLCQLNGVVNRVIPEFNYEIHLNGIEIADHGLHLLWGRAEFLTTL